MFKPAFIGDAGVTSTLEVEDVRLGRAADGTFFGLNGSGYNPADAASGFGGFYKLTTKEGAIYRIDANTGDVETITDPNGNTITFTDAGVASSTGQAIDFERDANNRVAAILDPLGERILYEYDVEGDLIAVTNREENTTQFNYLDTRTHFLDEVIDPSGNPGARINYDEQGRLQQVLDVNGEATLFSFDPNNSVQDITDIFGTTRIYEYDERGNILTEIDPTNTIVRRKYDINNNIIEEIVSTGPSESDVQVTTFTYDNLSNRLSRTNPLGETDLYTYTSGSQLTSRVNPLGHSTLFEYDDNGNLRLRQDAEGNITIYNYDSRGNLLVVDEGTAGITTFTYDRFNNVESETDALGNTTIFTYDLNGNQLTESRIATTPEGVRTILSRTEYDREGNIVLSVNPEGEETRSEYDANGRRVTEIDALGRRTNFVYDEKGNLIETIFPDNTPENLSDNPRIQSGFNAAGNQIGFIDRENNIFGYTYSAIDQISSFILPDNSPEDLNDNDRFSIDYDITGLVSQITHPNDRITELEYDLAGRLVTTREFVSEGLFAEFNVIYDADGREIARINPLGEKTEFIYDNLDRLIETIYPDLSRETREYDRSGNLLGIVDRNGDSTRFEYDLLNRVTAVVNPLGHRTEYEYDEVGNLILQRDSNENETRFEYDGIGRQTAIVLPLSQRSQTVYDDVGNVIQRIDFNGETTNFEYNAENLLTGIDFLSEGRTLEFTYTPNGRRGTAIDERGTTIYEYDAQGNIISRTEPDGRNVSYTYDTSGNVTSVTTGSGTTQYVYDLLNRLDTVTRNGEITDYDYDLTGNITRIKYPNGIIESREYDRESRVTSINSQTQAGNILASYQYTYDAAGNITSVEELDGRIVTYTYDELNQLLREEIQDPISGNRTLEYTYDKVGNRRSLVDSIVGNISYVYDDNDRLILEIEPDNTIAYSYDENGNLLRSEGLDGNSNQYTWNSQNQLVQVESLLAGEIQTVVQYSYDADGIRIATNVNGEEIRYLIDNSQEFEQVLEEYTPDLTTLRSYVHGLSRISESEDGVSTFLLHDEHSGIRQITDGNGQVLQEYAYDAYGNPSIDADRPVNEFLYQGEAYDEAVDLQYLRARYYDPSIGRFISTDPFPGFIQVPQSRHKYLYANNNPVNITDPSGLIALIEQTSASQTVLGIITNIYASAIGLVVVQVGISSALPREIEWNGPLSSLDLTSILLTRGTLFEGTSSTGGAFLGRFGTSEVFSNNWVQIAFGIPLFPSSPVPDFIQFGSARLLSPTLIGAQAGALTGGALFGSARSGIASLGTLVLGFGIGDFAVTFDQSFSRASNVSFNSQVGFSLPLGRLQDGIDVT
ncbi:RHS repeat-associated core domain-containing protein [Synechococcus sp. PCC 7336]|uniref:RHS repeat-associated core domain-containing protein n=1 Tax=Synechococcus sp. PCC 7336 TaxID=195250 RepID=UPI00034B9D1C|nr:RHS repeat-associated core domain-containing protein [Synechococcus sp. PCC 7336]